MRFLSRALGAALPALIAIALPLPAIAQTAPAAAQPDAPIKPNLAPDSQKPWLYQGSDLPPHPDWTFGVLPNGLRYAVRRNGVPPGQVSIRVRIDAGSLMESEDQRGYAHLIEHLSFRGSEYAGDMESKRIWQRLGVTFGSDTNASTTFTQTVYQLDLPSANDASLDESMHILAGMMEAPDLDQKALDAERPVVLAEQREQPSAQVRFGDASRELFFAGQPLADRSPIGTIKSLQAATPASVQAFHDRWYRPDRTVIVISGDMDPALFVQMIKKHFAGWQGKGPDPKTPDFGKPDPNEPVSANIVEPAFPPVVGLAYVRPWTVGDDTIIFNQKRMIDMVAVRIVNRRLERRARSGGSYITANVSLDDVSRSANVTTVSVLPVGDDWQKALHDVRAVIADARTNPPSQAEIDREVNEILAVMKNAVATSAGEAGARQADNMVDAVDIHETLTTSETSLKILEGAVAKKFFTPANVLASSKKVFDGVAVRAIVNTPKPDPQAPAELAAALKEDVSGAAGARASARKVGWDDLPSLGKPGTVTARKAVMTDPDIEQVTFANGVNLLMFPNTSEAGKVYVRVRFGHGYNALPGDRVTPAWSGDIALAASGIGDLTQDDIDRLTGDRQIGMDFGIDNDAFEFSATTTAADLADQLRLIAAKLARPGWDPNPVKRARAVTLASYDSLSASPNGVIARDLRGLLRDGDPRWATPPRKAVADLTPQAFRDFWAPILASGPVEVQVFGDADKRSIIDAVAKSFGALKPRAANDNLDPAPVRFPDHDATPVVRYHGGKDDQAAAVIAWPTGGGVEQISQSRKLELLAAIFRDRLLDQLRSEAGASYTPQVVNEWPVGLPSGGDVLAVGLVPPAKTDLFFRLARGIAADLAANPVSQDELDRAIKPLKQLVIRMSTGNIFWMDQTKGGSTDPRRIAAIDTLPTDIVQTTPAEIQALAAKYLRPDKDWSMIVLPKDEAPE
ncbi:M16 family metallopeptidase [Stakelama marina]|uniref:Insulinase family protein n=1 Tax=Stakelama marina TaxID=2826939 RepID=A0A8T4IFH3_9SPHN|nr:insulinase family protein [Stakelama marina]MBR0552614.1 insulinase family protein [Stakelama marina]